MARPRRLRRRPPASGPVALSGRVALVTGAARGIGRAIALALAREGADIACADLLPAEETARAVRALGRRAITLKVDNVSSLSGVIGGVLSTSPRAGSRGGGRSGPAYAAAKGGGIALTKWLAKDLGADGIYVNAIAPAGVESAMTKGFKYKVAHFPVAPWGSPRTSRKPSSTSPQTPPTTSPARC